MKKTIFVLMIALMTVSVYAQNNEVHEAYSGPCDVVGELQVKDFSEDIACKHLVWAGRPILTGMQNGGPPTFYYEGDCVNAGLLIAEGMIDEEKRIVMPIQAELHEIAEEDGTISDQQRQALRVVADTVPNKLKNFYDDCTTAFDTRNGPPMVTMDAEQYITCKTLLADTMEQIGKAAQITWFTSHATWKVQILEAIQTNLQYVLANFDEHFQQAYRQKAIEVDCSVDPNVDLVEPIFEDSIGLNNGPPPTFMVELENAVAAKVSVVELGFQTENGGPLAIPLEGCMASGMYEGPEKRFIEMTCVDGGLFYVDWGDGPPCVRAALVDSVEGSGNDPFNDWVQVGNCNPAGGDPVSLGPTGGAITGGTSVPAGEGSVFAVAIAALFVVALFIYAMRRK